MPLGASIFGSVRGVSADLEALLLPPACLSCGTVLPSDADPGCCGVCRSRLRRLTSPSCPRCGQPLDPWDGRRAGRAAGTPAASCGFCASWPPSLGWATSAAWLDDGPARDLVHGLKYDGWRVAAVPMADALAREGAERFRSVDVLVPVPLGRRRQRQRGYNQAAVLAAALAARVGLPWRTPLARRRETRSQTALGPGERWANVAGAFLAEAVVPGTRVALVDDVLTTGATLAACAAALRDAGAGVIGAVTFARAAIPD